MYLFMQLGTIKSGTDTKAAVDRLTDIRRLDDRDAAISRIVAGDEETCQSMSPGVNLATSTGEE